MKIVYTILFLFISITVWSQDLTVQNLPKKIKVGYQKSNIKSFEIQNYNNTEKSIRIIHNSEQLQGGSTLSFCYENKCYSSKEPLIIKIPANSTSKSIRIKLTGGISTFKSSVYFEIVDLDIDQTLKKEITVEISEERIQDLFYSKGDLSVNSFFPNPAIESAIMEYSINPNEKDAKIIIQNVLGSIVTTYNLNPDENKLSINTENLNPGVYFYTLSVKDEGLATRKLIIKN
ncbi:T9SS type A sorting domain-containing protein [Marivirga sp.]|uniref:T9SS type A sorting domain-containing protein n=1 Tax=Marivirga sp. TaxID=2018662 RepID=UPI002D7EC022|nr:T9SS type A sorting domain-containing protein [Marivirga sp.]HET8861316.1 T9SS type A sorting domain-containing protein [Marivirga sp.]